MQGEGCAPRGGQCSSACRWVLGGPEEPLAPPNSCGAGGCYGWCPVCMQGPERQPAKPLGPPLTCCFAVLPRRLSPCWWAPSTSPCGAACSPAATPTRLRRSTTHPVRLGSNDSSPLLPQLSVWHFVRGSQACAVQFAVPRTPAGVLYWCSRLLPLPAWHLIDSECSPACSCCLPCRLHCCREGAGAAQGHLQLGELAACRLAWSPAATAGGS